MPALLIVVALAALYLGGKNINGRKYGPRRFFEDIALGSLLVIAAFIVCWMVGVPQ